MKLAEMKVACIDKSAADRLKLQRLLEDAYDSCRASIGHLLPAVLTPRSREEVLFAETPDAVVIGPSFSAEESISCCREMREKHGAVPLLVFLSAEHYNFRTLRRFEQFTSYIFSITEPLARFLHCLSLLDRDRSRKSRALLVAVSGVKGGVGATTIVAGLAHAAEAIGKSALVIDFSAASSLAHYLATPRRHSADYTAFLMDGSIPEPNALKKLITIAPNGIHLLLPPTGGSQIRDLWLREPKRFELSLEIVEMLRDLYDVVLVDMSAAEGLLPFALQARADVRTVVTSNEPASVHLLAQRLLEWNEIPGAGVTQVLVNRLFERGLRSEDIEDFVESHCQGTGVSATSTSTNPCLQRPLQTISFDASGRGWIGTGNSVYTEGSKQLQLQLESFLGPLLIPNYRVAPEQVPSRVKHIVSSLVHRFRRPILLPASSPFRNVLPAPKEEPLSPREPSPPMEAATDSIAHLYEPPKLVANT